jgi:hypothetical protein
MLRLIRAGAECSGHAQPPATAIYPQRSRLRKTGGSLQGQGRVLSMIVLADLIVLACLDSGTPRRRR